MGDVARGAADAQPVKEGVIVCLGWGSLIWDPRGLHIGDWNSDGPFIPVEFARESSRNRMTLVVMERGPSSQVLWAEVAGNYLDEAINELMQREGCPKVDIGRWPNDTDCSYLQESAIGVWAIEKGFSGVVWTALPAGFRGRRGTVPTEADVLAYLLEMDEGTMQPAKEYIAKAPSQIVTSYRTGLERALGL
jgi:hypothetical protein